jgi:hypothetical protein
MLFNKQTPNKEMIAKQAELEGQYMLLKEECANYKRTISAFVGVKSGYETEVSNLKKAHAKEISDWKTKLEHESKSINRKVNQALANIGVNKFAPEEIVASESSAISPQAIYSKFMSLHGDLKTEYFKENEKILSKLVGLN